MKQPNISPESSPAHPDTHLEVERPRITVDALGAAAIMAAISELNTDA